jgi:hypothetical protein
MSRLVELSNLDGSLRLGLSDIWGRFESQALCPPINMVARSKLGWLTKVALYDPLALDGGQVDEGHNAGCYILCQDCLLLEAIIRVAIKPSYSRWWLYIIQDESIIKIYQQAFWCGELDEFLMCHKLVHSYLGRRNSGGTYARTHLKPNIYTYPSKKWV